jgi:hypothetical protein
LSASSPHFYSINQTLLESNVDQVFYETITATQTQTRQALKPFDFRAKRARFGHIGGGGM